MSTAIAPPQESAPEAQFDPKAYIASRNSGKTAAEAREGATKPAEAKPEGEAAAEGAKPAAEPQHESRRSAKRRELAAIREAADAKARLEQLQELIESGKIAAPGAKADDKKADAEPKRADFPAGEAGSAEYLRACQKWDRAQEAKTAIATGDEAQKTEELKKFLGEMDEKAVKDMKSLKDWDKVLAAAKDHEDLPEFIADEHPTLMAMLARSDMRAFLLYHWAKPENFAAFQDLLDLSKSPEKQIAAFHRLEGRLEKLYDAERSETTDPTATEAAEPEKGKKDRTHLAEAATPGEPQREVPAKPKPSSEVAARGGSPAPDEPPIGSAAWMAKRNQKLYGR